MKGKYDVRDVEIHWKIKFFAEGGKPCLSGKASKFSILLVR